eukprot:CAMPEP_0173292724 /NCGR_PEP_ID=MMETSP1143-20121109/12895_1 /TAXON_ID=483371 /ORGANISM="non described non described, Strain CCMP2298" /LENGTH=631 /DNA_ID=CAMNT_0014232159 /DNA_START=41 /DNA_END=1933 /DNA_ORIENTATION=-
MPGMRSNRNLLVVLFVALCSIWGDKLCAAFTFGRTGAPRASLRMVATNERVLKQKDGGRRQPTVPPELHTGYVTEPADIPDVWAGRMEGIDWELEKARRAMPGFAPIRMTLWQPDQGEEISPPGFLDDMKILLNNAMQMAGLAESMDGAPVVQGVNTYRGDPIQFISRILDGNLAELAGGPLFLLVAKYYEQYGAVFKLAFGPKSFIVVSDPVMAKHILKENSLKYDKGILADILEPIMGKGLIPADPATWKIRRRAIVPGFHKAWYNEMCNTFVQCNSPLVSKLTAAADNQEVLNMEDEFCSVALDIIGKAVFNYDFGSVTKESPVIKSVYSALKEAEHRSLTPFPYWQLPFANQLVPRLRNFNADLHVLDKVLNELISETLASQNQESVEALEKRDYSTMNNPSLLRFLVDMRGEDTTSVQLRDDLMTMLIAGHETTAAVLTWAMFELSQQPELMAKVQAEIDTVLGDRPPTFDDVKDLQLVRLVVAESLRMYPEPPLLIRRALEDQVLPAGAAGFETKIARGTDIFIAIYNIHRSPMYWENPDTFDPTRFLRPFKNPDAPHWAGYEPITTTLYPNEVHSDYAYLPFGAGARKCIGDQFALMESVVTLAVLLKKFDFQMAMRPEDVGVQ